MSKIPWFQFHKGSIKTRLGLPYPLYCPGFNSIKVRLRRRSFVCISGRSSFNSIKVRLRRGHVIGVVSRCVFQFHKGSIKTYIGFCRNYFVCMFQFHKGSIKTKQKRQPTLQVNAFQFHKGSIKTVFLNGKQLLTLCFNSIKVRLRP